RQLRHARPLRHLRAEVRQAVCATRRVDPERHEKFRNGSARRNISAARDVGAQLRCNACLCGVYPMNSLVTNPAFWSRVQFAFTITYHYLFPQLTMGLAWFLVYWKWRALRTGDEKYNH